MYLSKSKYCLSTQCNKILWLDKYKGEEKEETANANVLENGTEVGIYAKKLFGEYTDIEFNEDLSKMIEDTKEALKKTHVTITEASFSYENCFCSVDILKKNNDEYELYEVKSSTEIKDIYLSDVAYQYYVLRNLGLNVTSANVVYINSNYVRRGDIELNKLFNIEDVTAIAKEKQDEVEQKIIEINKYMENKNEQEEEIGMHCFKPYDCPFFKYCTKHLPTNNIFNIRRMPIKEKLKHYENKTIKYEDLLKTNIKDIYKDQIEFELSNKEPKINRLEISKFLDTLSYPLYFLDFETFQQAIPEFEGVRPYMQIPFQYSLHYIEKENGSLKHKEFLAESNIDPRRNLALKLVNDIPKNSCVLAYNMTFEKTVIKELAKLYPDLKEDLMAIHDNIKDLMIPFKEHHYYTKEMEGSYSIKYVLPALFPNDPSLNYHNLDLIHNGSEAMNSYATLSLLNKEEQEKIRASLLKYCELDTYAMVKIWEKLKEVTAKELLKS